jgi:hypothetical protein
MGLRADAKPKKILAIHHGANRVDVVLESDLLSYARDAACIGYLVNNNPKNIGLR